MRMIIAQAREKDARARASGVLRLRTPPLPPLPEVWVHFSAQSGQSQDQLVDYLRFCKQRDLTGRKREPKPENGLGSPRNGSTRERGRYLRVCKRILAKP